MPSITSWTRLEPRCRDADMQRTVNGRVFDPLWMLTRQWQVGEYRGEDAGTPISVRVRAENASLSRISLGHLPPETQTTAAVYDPDAAPLEVMVERQPVRPAATDTPGDTRKLALAVDAGLHFLRMLDQQPLSLNYRSNVIARFAVTRPDANVIDALDAETRARLEAMAGRAPDARRMDASFRSQGTDEVSIDPALQIAAADMAEVQLTAKRWLDDLSSDVPEHWVPLLPVQIPLATGGVQTRLKRGAVLVADGTERVRSALGEILATGGELLLRDEEVPREGVRVTRQYELARWIGGTTFLWAGRKKQVGRGEGSSGLAFDRELRSGEPQP